MTVHERHPTYRADQRAFFDALITEEWPSYISADWDALRRNEVTQLFKRVAPATILDIGCGCGFHDKEMARYPFVREVHGIDYSGKSIEAAEREYPDPKVRRSTADLRDLPSANYDLVASWQVFEHLDDPKAYFESALRVCKKGGHIAIFTPNRMRLSNVLRILKRQPIQYLDPQHFHEYTAGEIRALGHSFGLTVVATFGQGLSGIGWIDRLPIERRLRLGGFFSPISDGICVLFRK
jgi:2-polyprenyl-3-methyl-5-hydroxy-6-metoxy-1,4-benzoquinol methylase